MQIHIVRQGETLMGISELYGVPLENFLADNGLTGSSRAVIGQALLIIEPDITHTVSRGETLLSIAEEYQTSVKVLLRNNYFLKGSSNIKSGDVIYISLGGEPKTKEFLTNGYAYPFIEKGLLSDQLPYLTYLSPFTYGLRENGSLVELAGDDPMISAARTYGAGALMHLSTLTEYGSFSNERANLVFENGTVRKTLIREILENIEVKGYDGLDVDFEFIYPEDKFEYVLFLQELRRELEPLGYPLFSALAPKVSDDMVGTLYEGHDYGAIGAAVDKVLLMTYEWGYTYSEPMAVAPINKVEEVVRYALTRIPETKILMGIPTYGYDWRLPYERGVTKAVSLSPVECIRIAERYDAVINYDETAQTPWFRYTNESGELHEVWFEDVRSIDAKLNLAAEYDLAGLGYWNLMREFPQNWVLLNAKYNIENI